MRHSFLLLALSSIALASDEPFSQDPLPNLRLDGAIVVETASSLHQCPAAEATLPRALLPRVGRGFPELAYSDSEPSPRVDDVRWVQGEANDFGGWGWDEVMEIVAVHLPSRPGVFLRFGLTLDRHGHLPYPDVVTWLFGPPGGRTGPTCSDAMGALEDSWEGPGPTDALGVLLPLTHESAVIGIAFSRDRSLVWSLDASGRTLVWDSESLAHMPQCGLETICAPEFGWASARPRDLPPHVRLAIEPACTLYAASGAASPDGKVAAVGAWSGEVRLYEVDSGACMGSLTTGNHGATCLAFRADGHSLIVGGQDGSLRVWKLDASVEGASPELMWEALAGEDALAAERAVWTLAASPRGVEVLDAKMHELCSRIARSLQQLDDEDWSTREEASKQLSDLRDVAAPLFKRAREGTLSAEARARLQDLDGSSPAPAPLARPSRGTFIRRIQIAISPQRPSAEMLRILRAVRALEHSGTTDARRVLRWIAREFEPTQPSTDASAALGRLGEPPPGLEAH